MEIEIQNSDLDNASFTIRAWYIYLHHERRREGGGGGERLLNVRPKTGCVKAKIGANRKIDSSRVTDHQENYVKAVVPGSNLIPVKG